jgi:hypothetical protein
MRPRERRETGEQDLFRSRLDQIIDLKHALVKLSRTIDWHFLESQFGSVYSDVLALLGRGTLFSAPFRNSISRACLPTMRSTAAIFVSYS